MSRSGLYEDDGDDPVAYERWRARVASATRSKRGQRFFRALVAALDAMPAKRLIAGDLENDGDVCALGSLARAKGANLDPDDTYDYAKLSATFDIAEQLAQEVMWWNDEVFEHETPEERWGRVRAWAAEQIRATGDPSSSKRTDFGRRINGSDDHG